MCDHRSLFGVSLRRAKGPCLSLDGGSKSTCSLTLRKGEKTANDRKATEWQVTDRGTEVTVGMTTTGPEYPLPHALGPSSLCT